MKLFIAQFFAQAEFKDIRFILSKISS